MTNKVLITGAGALLGQEIFNSLRHTKLISDLFIGFADPSPSAAGLYWSDASHTLPMASCDTYIDSLVDLLSVNGYQFLIPGTDVELLKISRARDQIESLTGCKVIVSSPQIIDIANDKYLTATFLSSLGFLPPKSWIKDTLPAENMSLLPYPLIVKPRNGARSIGVLRVDNPAQLEHALTITHDPVIQECIGSNDDEYTAGSLSFDGTCHTSIVMKRTLRDGNTWTAKVINSKFLTDIISSMAHKLMPYGPCNFQFRLDSHGVPRVFEINARFSGTTYMRTLAGFEEVAWSLLYARDGIIPSQFSNTYKDLFFMRSFMVTAVPSPDRD